MEEASRKRRKIESDEEINVEGKKLTNKERAKIHRDRKKKYYEELEQKVEKLEQEIRELKEKYEIALSQGCCDCCVTNVISDNEKKPVVKQMTRCKKHELIEDEKFIVNDLPNLIEQRPEQFRMTLFDNIKDKTGTFGTERISFLKYLFNEMLEHIVPTDTKLFMLMNKQGSASKLVKLGLMK